LFQQKYHSRGELCNIRKNLDELTREGARVGKRKGARVGKRKGARVRRKKGPGWGGEKFISLNVNKIKLF